MSKVLTQNDIPEIVNSAVMLEQASKAILATTSSIVKYASKVDVKDIEQGDKKMVTISKMMSSYAVIVGDIINTLNMASVNDKDLASICGKIDETTKDPDGSIKKVTKWTNLDALLQISNIISGLIKGITANDRVEKLSIFGKMKFKNDVKMSVDLAMYAFTSLTEELLKIGDMGVIKDLMEVLVDGPEIVEELSTHRDDSEKFKDDEKKKIYDFTEKVSKKGKVGLLTAMKGIFDLLKMMLELEPPGVIGMMLFRLKIQNFGKMLQITIDEFSKILKQIATEELLNNSVTACKVISGTGKEGEDGILGIVTSMMSIVEIINGFPNPILLSKKLELVGKLFEKIVNTLVGIFVDPKTFKPTKAVDALISKDFNDVLEKVKDTVNAITDVTKSISDAASTLLKAGALAILAIPGTFIVTGFLYAIKFFVKILLKVLDGMDGKNFQAITENLTNLADLLKSIVKIELALLAAGALAIPALAAGLLATMFMFALIAFAWAANKAFDIIATIINRDMKKDIKEFVLTLKSLGMIALAIILLGLVTPAAIGGMLMVAFFMLALIPFVYIIGLVFDVIARIINRDMKKDMRELVMTLLWILALQALIFIIGKFAGPTMKVMLVVALFLLAVAALILVLKLVLMIVDKLINKSTKDNMIELAMILMAVVVIEVIILIMGSFAVKASKAGLLSLVFLVVLMIFVLILKLVVMLIDKLINESTISGIIQLLTVVALLLVIEIMMVIMGAMAVKAIIGIALGLVFLVLLLVFVAILGALGYLLNSYGAMLTGPAIAGLTQLLIIIGLLLATALMLVLLGMLAKKLKIGAIVMVLATVMVALVMIAIIGVLALATSPALPGLLTATGCVALLFAMVLMLKGIEALNVTMGIVKPLLATMAAMGLVVAIGVIALLTVVALPGLAIATACAVMLLVIVLTFKGIEAINLTMAIVGPMVATLAAMGLLVAIGIASLLTIIALPGMAYATAATALLLVLVLMLRGVQEIELTTKVTKPIMASLAAIGAIILVGMAGIGAILALAFMPMNIALCGMYYGVAKKLNDIAHFDLDAKKLKKKISDSKSVLNYIKSAFGGFSFSWRQKRKAKKALSAMTSILNPVRDILRKLNHIGHMKLDAARILSNIELVFKTVDKVQEKIDNLTQIPKNKDGSIDWKSMIRNSIENALKAAAARGKMNRTDRILVKVLDITKKLKKIADIEIDSAMCIKNIDLVFSTVDKIEKKIDELTEIPKKDNGSIDWKNLFKNSVEKAIKSAAAKGKLNRTDKILATVYDITSKLKSIADLKIDTEVLEKNLAQCFDAVDRIEEFINKRNELPNGEQRGLVGLLVNNIMESFKAAAANNSLKRTDKILGSVHNIVKTLESIQNVKVDTTKIMTKLEDIFAAVDKIDEFIEKRSNMSDAEKMSWWDRIKNRIAAAEKAKMQEEQAKDLDRISTIMTNVSTITKTLKEIMDIKVDPNKAQQKTENVLNSVEAIYEQITGKISGGGWFESASKQQSGEVITKVCEELNMLNSSLGGLSGISDKAVANTGKTLDHYSKFLTKIDGLKVENLEKSVNMFSQMARFSESISGNFEAMARSIEEKLMPTLEELRDLVEELPEAIEKSSENMVSAVDKMGEATTSAAKSAGDNMAAAAKTQNDSASQIRQIGSKIDKLTKTLTGGDVKVKIKS
jgi:hypothetical protein